MSHDPKTKPRAPAPATTSAWPVVVFAAGLLVMAGGVWRNRALNTKLPLPDDLTSLAPSLAHQLDVQLQLVRDRRDDPDGHGRLGILYEAHGYTDLALRCYQRACELGETTARWRHHWSVLQDETGNAAAAEQGFRDVLALEPDYPPAIQRLALLLLERSAPDKATGAFERLVKVAPSAPQGYLGLARIALMAGEAQRAVDHLRRALAVAPNTAEAHHLLGRAYQELGLREAAQAEFVHSGQAEPTVVRDPWRDEVGRMNRTVPARLAEAQGILAWGDVGRAADLLKELLADEPEDEGIAVTLAGAYLRIGRLDDARRVLSAALAINPDYALTHLRLAALAAAENKFPDALQHVENATRLDPTSAEGFLLTGTLLRRMGRHGAALTAFSRAKGLAPMQNQADNDMALTLVNLERWDEAIEAYRRVVASNPTSALDHYRLALLLDQQQRPEEALPELRTAATLAPGNQSIRRTLARVETQLASP